MLYLGIDQHRKQLTVSVRNEAGDVILRRQVSTEWDRVRAFFDELRRSCRTGRRIRRDRRGLRLQRLAAENADRIRLPRNGADPGRETVEEEDRPPRRPPTQRHCCGSTGIGSWRANEWRVFVASSRRRNTRPKIGK